MVEDNREIPQHKIEFLLDLYNQGIEISEEDKALLIERDLIIDHTKFRENIPIAHELKTIGREKPFKKGIDLRIKRDDDKDADEHIDVVHEAENTTEEKEEDWDAMMIEGEDNYEDIIGKKAIYQGRSTPIKKEEWLPKSVIYHTTDFVRWIDSILFDGFANKINYKPFQLYCQQADEWYAENKRNADFRDEWERDEWQMKEIERCSENGLYFLNKYLQLKEGAMDSGSREYVAVECHKIICYLEDAGYSFMLGKPRQIAATTTLGGMAVKDIVFQKNFFLKFITQDKLKGEEIFNDKIKYAFSQLPDWMKPKVRNDRDNILQLGDKDIKGSQSGVNSKIEVVAPSKTAISGGTPTKAKIDEAGNINILSQIIADGRPTLFWMNPKTKLMEMKRQVIVWGTGGDMLKGGKAFEREFMSLVKMWQERKFTACIVPIFFDWTTRPGVTQEVYDNEHEVAYSKEGPDADEAKTLFHQQYPLKIQDMFLSSHKTMVGHSWIDTQLKRINKTEHLMREKFGYFEPIYDTATEMSEGSDVPYKIIGANFIPTEGEHDTRTTTTIFSHPKEGWIDRYYQGTDPIASDNGLSNMASAIWDDYYHTIAAVVNFRVQDYKYCFQQCTLLGMYYDVNAKSKKTPGVKELLETNIGTAYRDYKENKGLEDTLVLNTELPLYLQTGSGNSVGIDNRQARWRMIFNKMYELTTTYGESIYIKQFFNQLTTFVCTITDSGKETWGPADKKHYKDDILFAATFAYICRLCYPELSPKSEKEEKRKPKTLKFVTQYDKQWNLKRVATLTNK